MVLYSSVCSPQIKRAIYSKLNLMLLLEILKAVQGFDISLLFAGCNTLCGGDEG